MPSRRQKPFVKISPSVQVSTYAGVVSQEAVERQERFAVEASKGHRHGCRCDLCRVARFVARERRQLNLEGSAQPAQAPKGPEPPAANPGGSDPDVTDPDRTTLYRALGNLASPHALARLKAVHEVGLVLLAELKAAIDAAELAQVRQARSYRPQPSWREIGRVLGVTGQYAARRFGDRL